MNGWLIFTLLLTIGYFSGWGYETWIHSRQRRARKRRRNP